MPYSASMTILVIPSPGLWQVRKKSSRGGGNWSDRYRDTWGIDGLTGRQEREGDKKLTEKGFHGTAVQTQSYQGSERPNILVKAPEGVMIPQHSAIIFTLPSRKFKLWAQEGRKKNEGMGDRGWYIKGVGRFPGDSASTLNTIWQFA